MNQAIYRKTTTTTVTFTDKPSEVTRDALIAAGFQFDGRAKQWFRSENTAEMIGEDSVANSIAA